MSDPQNKYQNWVFMALALIAMGVGLGWPFDPVGVRCNHCGGVIHTHGTRYLGETVHGEDSSYYVCPDGTEWAVWNPR